MTSNERTAGRFKIYFFSSYQLRKKILFLIFSQSWARTNSRRTCCCIFFLKKDFFLLQSNQQMFSNYDDDDDDFKVTRHCFSIFFFLAPFVVSSLLWTHFWKVTNFLIFLTLPEKLKLTQTSVVSSLNSFPFHHSVFPSVVKVRHSHRSGWINSRFIQIRSTDFYAHGLDFVSYATQKSFDKFRES